MNPRGCSCVASLGGGVKFDSGADGKGAIRGGIGNPVAFGKDGKGGGVNGCRGAVSMGASAPMGRHCARAGAACVLGIIRPRGGATSGTPGSNGGAAFDVIASAPGSTIPSGTSASAGLWKYMTLPLAPGAMRGPAVGRRFAGT